MISARLLYKEDIVCPDFFDSAEVRDAFGEQDQKFVDMWLKDRRADMSTSFCNRISGFRQSALSKAKAACKPATVAAKKAAKTKVSEGTRLYPNAVKAASLSEEQALTFLLEGASVLKSRLDNRWRLSLGAQRISRCWTLHGELKAFAICSHFLWSVHHRSGVRNAHSCGSQRRARSEPNFVLTCCQTQRWVGDENRIACTVGGRFSIPTSAQLRDGSMQAQRVASNVYRGLGPAPSHISQPGPWKRASPPLLWLAQVGQVAPEGHCVRVGTSSYREVMGTLAITLAAVWSLGRCSGRVLLYVLSPGEARGLLLIMGDGGPLACQPIVVPGIEIIGRIGAPSVCSLLSLWCHRAARD